MNILKNNKGASFILFTIMMGMILLALLGAVFGSMYNAQDNAKQLRSGLDAQIILQQLGAITVQAYQEYQISGGACLGGTSAHPSFGGGNLFCFPDPICVPHPISSDLLLCDNDAAPMLQAMTVQQGVSASIDIDLPFKQKLKFFVNNLLNIPKKIALYVAGKSNYFSNQLKAGVIIPVDFTVAAPAPTAINSACGAGTLCKNCSINPGAPTSTELPCMRFRVCPHYGGCNTANDNEWIVQKVGVLIGAPNP